MSLDINKLESADWRHQGLCDLTAPQPLLRSSHSPPTTTLILAPGRHEPHCLCPWDVLSLPGKSHLISSFLADHFLRDPSPIVNPPVPPSPRCFPTMFYKTGFIKKAHHLLTVCTASIHFLFWPTCVCVLSVNIRQGPNTFWVPFLCRVSCDNARGWPSKVGGSDGKSKVNHEEGRHRDTAERDQRLLFVLRWTLKTVETSWGPAGHLPHLSHPALASLAPWQNCTCQ